MDKVLDIWVHKATTFDGSDRWGVMIRPPNMHAYELQPLFESHSSARTAMRRLGVTYQLDDWKVFYS